MKRQLLLFVLLGICCSRSSWAIVVNNKTILQDNPITKNVLDHGMAQDGTDQSAVLTDLLQDNVHLFFPKGKYHFTETVLTGSLENFILEGEAGTEIITNKPIFFAISGSLKKVLIKKIAIRSNDTTPKSFGQLSLIHSNEQNITDLTFEDVLMSAPKSATNALKFINERNTRTKGVVLTRFKVDSIGRMGLEIQNHIRNRGEAEVSRYENIKVIDSEFNNTGLREFGMGVSVGGLGENVSIVNSSFGNSPDRAIEFIGTKGVRIEGNCFVDNYSSIVVTRNEIVTKYPTRNVTVTGNVAEASEGEGFINVENLRMRNNKFNIKGRIKFEAVKDANVETLILDTDAYTALEIGALENFDLHHSRIKNRRTGNNLIRIQSESIDLKIRETDLITGRSQYPYDFVGDAISVPEFSKVNVYDSNGKLVEVLGGDR